MNGPVANYTHCAESGSPLCLERAVRRIPDLPIMRSPAKPASIFLAGLLLLLLLVSGCLSPEGGSSADDSPTPSPTPTITPTAEPTPAPTEEPGSEPTSTPDEMPSETPNEECASLLVGPPVGLACLHCTHPRAQAQALVLADVMRASCRQAIVTNVLIDGRFGLDDPFLIRLLNRLAAGRDLTVLLYLSNGVSQRARDPFDPLVFGTGTSVESFRDAIGSDEGFRLAYQQVAARGLSIRNALPESARVILVPGLEDNLTDDLFDNVLELTREVGGDRVLYGRNPCPNCAAGNGSGIPVDVIGEIHTPVVSPLVSGGVITNDGFPYVFEFQGLRSSIHIGSLATTKSQALAQGNMFILWTAHYQGLPVNGGLISGRPDPDDRIYAVPTTEETAELLELLGTN